MHRRVLAVCAATVVTVAVMGAAGCSGKKTDLSKLDSSPPAAPTEAVDDREAKARAAALDAYNRFTELYVKLSLTSDFNGKAALSQFVGEPLLGDLTYDLYLKNQQGLVATGQPVWRAKVSRANMSARPFTIEIEDCFDGTNWTTVYKATGKPAQAPGQALKYVVISEAVQYDDGRWKIRKSTPNRERSC